MPRPRHPSDDARLKRPKGVLISFEVLSPDPDKPGQAEAFSSLELRGMWVWLLVHAGRSFAGRTGDKATLNDGALAEITGRSHRQSAVKVLRKLCDLMDYSLEDRGHSVVVHVKNLSQNQGWAPRNSAELRDQSRTPRARASDSDSDSELDSDSDTDREEEKSASRSAAAAPDESESAEGKIPEPPDPEQSGPADPPELSDSSSPGADPMVPRRKRARRRDGARQQPALIRTIPELPAEPNARFDLLLRELRKYRSDPYAATDGERRLWLEAEIPGLEAWASANGKPLLTALHSFWKRYCDRKERPWREEASLEGARKKAAALEAEIARELAQRADSPPPELPEGFVIERVS